MKRAKFEAAKQIDKKLESVNQALSNMTKHCSFVENHKVHVLELNSYTPEHKGTALLIGGEFLTTKDMKKITDVVGDILLAKKAELEKEFAEI